MPQEMILLLVGLVLVYLFFKVAKFVIRLIIICAILAIGYYCYDQWVAPSGKAKTEHRR